MLSLVPGVFGFYGKHYGVLLALRRDGEEGFFVAREITCPVWIPIASFTIDPKGVASADEIRKMMEE